MSIYNSTENLWNKNRNKTLHENHLCQNIHIQTCATQLWGGGCSELGLKGWGKSLTCALVPEVWQIFNIWCTFSMAWIVAWCWFAFHREIFRIKSNYIGKKWYKCKYCNNAKHKCKKCSFNFFQTCIWCKRKKYIDIFSEDPECGIYSLFCSFSAFKVPFHKTM